MATSDLPPDPGPPAPKPPTAWDQLGTRVPILNSLAQFLLVTLLGTFAKCSVDDYTHNVERTKRVEDLTTALATQDTDKDITKRNLVLVTLDRLYSEPAAKPGWWRRHFPDKERQADDSLIFDIAEEVYRARMATRFKPEELALAQTRLSLAARIMSRRDSGRAKALLDSYKVAAGGKIRSTADTSAVATQSVASVPIAPGNKALLETTITLDSTGKAAPQPYCYIQFRVFTRATAQKLQQAFQQRGWQAPGVERVAGSYGCSVRYYFEQDAAKAKIALQMTQEFVQAQPGPPPQVGLVSLVDKKLEGKVPHGQIEVWLSPGAGK
jgi:hypothetical protein